MYSAYENVTVATVTKIFPERFSGSQGSFTGVPGAFQGISGASGISRGSQGYFKGDTGNSRVFPVGLRGISGGPRGSHEPFSRSQGS